MVTVFEYLPDEILLLVCLQLHPFDLVHAFGHLNARFDTLLCDYRLFRHINIDSNKIASNYTKYIIIYGRRGTAQTLRATVKCHWLDLSHFINLRKLILCRPPREQQNQLRTIIATTQNLRQLRQLTFIKFDDEEYISRSIMAGRFPNLIQCQLQRWHDEQDFTCARLQCENLQSLTLNILSSLNIAMNILSSLPNLVIFRVNSFLVSHTNANTGIVSSPHHQLKHFYISLSNWNGFGYFGDYCRIFDCLLPLAPKLTTLSVYLKMMCSSMNRDSAIGVQLLLTAIAEHLPADCCFDCSLPCQVAERKQPGFSSSRSYWHQQARNFISRITRIQSGLTKKHSTFADLESRRISKQYVKVYMKAHILRLGVRM
ncbi:unnamed protein product [Rotaria socialis]